MSNATEISEENDIVQGPNEVTEFQSSETSIPQAVSNEIVPVSVEIRRSSRGRNPPLWLKDFVSLSVNDGFTYPMANYMNYDYKAPSYQAYLSKMSDVKEPGTYNEVVHDPRWVEDMQLEIEALQITIHGILYHCLQERSLLGIDGYAK